jgi:hypothetical protein
VVSTPTRQPETIIKTQCLKTVSLLPSDSKPKGTLAMGCYGYQCVSYLYNFDQQKRYDLPNSDVCFSSVSPDGKLLACERYTSVPSTNISLVFYSPGGKIVKKIPMQKDWFASMWLNSEYFTVSLTRDPNEVPPTLLIDPYTGQQKLLLSNFPGLKVFAGAARSPFHFGSRSVVYDPTIELAVYPQTTDDGHSFIVLWDLQAQKALAKVEDLYPFLNHPVWSNDGKKFVVSVATYRNMVNDDSIDEVFSISRDGQIQQITHFGDFYSNVHIETGSLSPDGKFLAINVTYDHPGPDQKYSFLVINLETQEVIDYCIPPDSGNTAFWSLDNRYLAVGELGKSGQVIQSILINMQNATATQISDSAFPIGWMISP